MIEVELKFKMPRESRTLLQAKLDTLPFVRGLGHINNLDTYYDTADFDCLQQAVFIRIRNHAQLEMKFHEHADPAHMHCTERVFPLKSEPPLMKEMNILCSRFISTWRKADTVEEAIRINGLMEYAHIANRRIQYTYENLILCLDYVEGLGNFFEVETSCEDRTQIGQALARLQSFVSNLALPALQPVWSGYVEQWLHLHLPQVYQLRKNRGEDQYEDSDKPRLPVLTG
jgi:adenylate cyclase class IV